METDDSFSFVIVPIYRSYHFPVFLLKSLLKGKMVRAPSLKTAFKETEEKQPYMDLQEDSLGMLWPGKHLHCVNVTFSCLISDLLLKLGLVAA